MRVYAMADHGTPCMPVVERRQYQSRRSAERYASAHGLTIVDSMAPGEEYPAANDAEGWDRLRLAHGIAAR